MTKRPLVLLISSALILILLLTLVTIAVSSVRFGGGEPTVSRFRDCRELATWLNNSQNPDIYPYLVGRPAPTAPGAAEDGSTSGRGDSYSPTNVQVEGVDEADTVKTDGEYIYSINDEKVYIHRAVNGQLTLVETLEPNINPASLYVTDDYLVVLGSPFGKVTPLDTGVSDSRDSIIRPTVEQYSYVYAYEKQTWELAISTVVSGYTQSSRLFNNKIYLILTSWQYIYGDYSEESAENLLPKYTLNVLGEELTAPETALAGCNEVAYLGEYGVNPVAVVELNLTEKAVRSEVSFGQINTLYMSYAAIYVAAPEYNNNSFRPCPWWSQITSSCPPQDFNNSDASNIFKLDLASMDYTATGQVKGSLLNQYSMDEFEGNLRVATTHSEFSGGAAKVSSAVYVLDGELNIVGELTELAPGERVYAARFVGERAYLVTFRQVDPFFAVDLSNPSQPVVLGELKITGYSDYLHPIGDNMVLGIGREVDPRTQRVQEVKLALFDVSDPTRPLEVSKTTLDTGMDTTVLQNPKALYIELDRNRLALPQTQYGIVNTTYSFAVFTLDGNNLARTAVLPAGQSDMNKFYSLGGERALRIGEYFYTIGIDGIRSYTYDQLQEVSTSKY